MKEDRVLVHTETCIDEKGNVYQAERACAYAEEIELHQKVFFRCMKEEKLLHEAENHIGEGEKATRQTGMHLSALLLEK